VPPPLHTLKIWGAGVYSPRSYGAEFVCFLSVCPSRYDARHRKPRRCVYALNLGGTGISPPAKSAPGKKCPRTKAPPAKSGDILYFSGSRQLNHSSLLLHYLALTRAQHYPCLLLLLILRSKYGNFLCWIQCKRYWVKYNKVATVK